MPLAGKRVYIYILIDRPMRRGHSRSRAHTHTQVHWFCSLIEKGDTHTHTQVHGLLCSLIERGEPALFEQPAQTIPQLFKIFSTILETDTV